MSTPQYDIDKLISESASPTKLLSELAEKLSAYPPESLSKEERVVLAAWYFDSAYGNGIADLLWNQNYDVIAEGFRAMRHLGSMLLHQFVAAIEETFAAFGISCSSGATVWREQRSHLYEVYAGRGLSLLQLGFLCFETSTHSAFGRIACRPETLGKAS